MRIEIVLLDTIRSGNFTTFVHISFIKHLTLSVVVENVSSGRVHKVTTFISRVSILILDVTFIVLENDNVTLVIPVEVSKNITLIEVSLVHERRNENGLRLISKVFKSTRLNERNVLSRTNISWLF